MSTQRYIDTSFWDDTWVQELDPSEKLLYIYLLTNPLTNIAGVMELTIKRICFDTGFNADTVTRILGKFEDARKVFKYNNYIIIRNFPKHQQIENDRILKGIASILSKLPNDVLCYLHEIDYQLNIPQTFDNLCIPYPHTTKVLEEDSSKEEPQIPAYIQEPYKSNKSETQAFLQECFNLITEHNKTAVHKIPVSKDFFTFIQSYKEGRELLELTKKADIPDLRIALGNYLKVAKSKTWMNTFSISVFCKNYIEYTKEFFDMKKYINIPKDKVKLINDMLDNAIQQHIIFRQNTFIYHRKDWFALGMPEGKELQGIVAKWEEEDVKNNVNYQFALIDWEKDTE